MTTTKTFSETRNNTKRVPVSISLYVIQNIQFQFRCTGNLEATPGRAIRVEEPVETRTQAEARRTNLSQCSRALPTMGRYSLWTLSTVEPQLCNGLTAVGRAMRHQRRSTARFQGHHVEVAVMSRRAKLSPGGAYPPPFPLESNATDVTQSV